MKKWKSLKILLILLASAIMMVLGAMNATASTRVIDDNDTVILPGNTHPAVLSGRYPVTGNADATLPMNKMVLALKLPAEKQAAMDSFLVDVQNPSSPKFHKWLTQEDFAIQFGPAAEDITAVTSWLTKHGFSIDDVAKSGISIHFSGDVAQVQKTFKTKIVTIKVDGKTRHANSIDPSIPRGLSDVVAGVVSLHNIPIKSHHVSINHNLTPADTAPNFTNSAGNYFLTPGDFATIYNLNFLHSAGMDVTFPLKTEPLQT